MVQTSLPFGRLLAYGLPAMPTVALVLPTFSILPAFYAKYTGLSLEAIGLALLISRLLDVITDPVVGYLSHRTHGAYGRRKPWILAGALLGASSVYFLFAPPPDISITAFFALICVLYLGWTMIEIPYGAWGAELSQDYAERTRIVTMRIVLGTLGSFAFLAAPMLSESGEFDRAYMRQVGLVLALGLPACVMIAIACVPQGAQDAPNADEPGWRQLSAAIFRNLPFVRFVCAFCLASLAAGIYNGLLFIYVDSYLGLGNRYSVVAISLFVLTWISLPAWMWVLGKIDKHRGWMVGALGASLATPLLAFISPGPTALPWLLALVGLIAVGWAPNQIAPHSILADIIDYDQFRTGVNQGSNYFAVMSMLTKACVAIGSGSALLLTGLVGFDVMGDNDASTVRAFLVVMLGLPTAMNLAMIALLWKFPLGRHRQTVIRRWLERGKPAANASPA